MEFVSATLEAFGVFAHRPDIFWKDAVLHGRGTDDCREPSQVGRAPMGPAHVPESVSAQAGFETTRRVLPSADGICTGAGESPNGGIFPLRDLPRGEVPRAGQASEVRGVPTVSFDAIARFLGNQ
jgi:hypothetical protein